MKSYILTLGILSALSLEAAQTEPGTAASASAPVIQVAAYRGMPWLDNSKLPWLKTAAARTPQAKETQTATPADPNTVARKLDALLTTLNDDLANTESGLSALNSRMDSLMEFDSMPIEPAFPPIPAADYSALASRDMSSLISQDLSTLQSQNLSTSLAVPTSLPWVPWANKQGNVVVPSPEGPLVGPAYPPRTAWGNGPGVVGTTAGGAVYAMVPETPRAIDEASLEAIRDVQQRLENVQNDIESIRPLLESLSTNRISTPTFQQPYLVPTGRPR